MVAKTGTFKNYWDVSFGPLAVKVLLLFTGIRLLFFITTYSYFLDGSTSLSSILSAFFFGLRLDLICAFFLLIPIFILLLFKPSARIPGIVLLLLLIVPTLILVIDIGYFPFAKERLGLELIGLMANDNNIGFSSYVRSYWWLVIVLILLWFIILRYFKHEHHVKPHRNQIWFNLGLLMILFFLSRGGFRSRPLRSADASQYVSQRQVAMSLNPCLLMFESLVNVSSEPELDQLTPSEITPTSFNDSAFLPFNVVVIILESFGKEYTALNYNFGPNYTPFLNQLMEESIVFTDAYANGLKSMDAVPAIFSGIPRLRHTAYISGPGSMIEKPSLFNLLKTNGYHSMFFHGAHNQSMGFRSYLKSQGLDKYLGIEEYPATQRDFDQHWGILDAPYFQYFNQYLSKVSQPFVAGIFTLSSHHPYPVPAEMTGILPKGTLAIHQSIAYTDWALKEFFKSARKSEWFNQTVFVITADHSSENAMHAFRTPSGKYEIPLLIYSPANLKAGKISKTVSQIDILPTILDLLNYPESVGLLGQSGFRMDHNGLAPHYDNKTFHVTSNGWNFGIARGENAFLYNKKTDPNCLNNVVKVETQKADSLRQLMQNFHKKYLAY